MNRKSIDPVRPGLYTGFMARTSVLPSFVGNRDPYPETEGEEYGPLLSLLQPLPERFAEAVDGMRADAFGLPVRAFLKK